MLRIFLIEDEPENFREDLADECENISGERPEVEIETDFATARQRVTQISPDVIVLDLLRGGPVDDNAEGIDILSQIWDERFSPIVVHSAEAERALDFVDENHPFVEIVQKGRGSLRKVAEIIERFSPHINALDKVEQSIRATMHQTLRSVAPIVFSQAEPRDRPAMLVRAAKRHVAASIDISESEAGDILRSWEHYIFPPISKSLMTGDLLRSREEDTADPSSYCVVLTPSCDMVSTAGQTPKVESVLVADCGPALDILTALNIADNTNKNRATAKISPALSRGYEGWAMPMPELPGLFPAMTVSFRRLKLVPFNAIGAQDEEYERIASVDSPFRELVTWAYMQNTGRPGLPDRDFAEWAKVITDLMGST